MSSDRRCLLDALFYTCLLDCASQTSRACPGHSRALGAASYQPLQRTSRPQYWTPTSCIRSMTLVFFPLSMAWSSASSNSPDSSYLRAEHVRTWSSRREDSRHAAHAGGPRSRVLLAARAEGRSARAHSVYAAVSLPALTSLEIASSTLGMRFLLSRMYRRTLKPLTCAAHSDVASLLRTGCPRSRGASRAAAGQLAGRAVPPAGCGIPTGASSTSGSCRSCTRTLPGCRPRPAPR